MRCIQRIYILTRFLFCQKVANACNYAVQGFRRVTFSGWLRNLLDEFGEPIINGQHTHLDQRCIQRLNLMKIVGFKYTCDLDNWYFNQSLPLPLFKYSICPIILVLSRLGYRISNQIYLLFGCLGFTKT